MPSSNAASWPTASSACAAVTAATTSWSRSAASGGAFVLRAVVHRVLNRFLLAQAGLKADEADSGTVTLIRPSFKSWARPPT